MLGLTGGIATGKSTVARLFRQLGAKIIDADELAREVVHPGRQAWNEIVDAFGKEILRDDQTLDRHKLRQKIFADREARKRLESIVHPQIRALAERRINEAVAAGHQVVIYEAPLLFENQIHLWLRPVILVTCDGANQKQRLRQRDQLTEEEIQQHLDAQMSLEEKQRLADIIIENNGTLEELAAQVETVWKRI